MGVRMAKYTFTHSVLLVLLLLSVCGTYFSFHNLVATNQSVFYFWPITFTVSTLIIGLVLYINTSRAIDQNHKVAEQLESLKKTIEQSKNGQNGKTKGEHIEQQQVNTVEVASKLLPNANTENIEIFAEQLLKNISKSFEIVQGTYFAKNEKTNEFKFVAGYAFYSETQPQSFNEGETLPGQVAKNRETLLLEQIPEGYITILSGLGKGTPRNLLLVPIINEQGNCDGVFEVASFKPFPSSTVQILTALGKLVVPLQHKNSKPSQE